MDEIIAELKRVCTDARSISLAVASLAVFDRMKPEAIDPRDAQFLKEQLRRIYRMGLAALDGDYNRVEAIKAEGLTEIDKTIARLLKEQG